MPYRRHVAQVETMRRVTPKVLQSREAAEQLHCEASTYPCNSTRAAAARGVNSRRSAESRETLGSVPVASGVAGKNAGS